MHNTKWLRLHTVFFRGHHKCLNWRVLDLDKSLDVKWNVFKKERSSVVWEPTRHYFRGHVFIQFIFHLSTLYRNFFFPSWKWKVFWAHLNKIAEMAQEVKKKIPNILQERTCVGWNAEDLTSVGYLCRHEPVTCHWERKFSGWEINAVSVLVWELWDAEMCRKCCCWALDVRIKCWLENVKSTHQLFKNTVNVCFGQILIN